MDLFTTVGQPGKCTDFADNSKSCEWIFIKYFGLAGCLVRSRNFYKGIRFLNGGLCWVLNAFYHILILKLLGSTLWFQPQLSLTCISFCARLIVRDITQWLQKLKYYCPNKSWPSHLRIRIIWLWANSCICLSVWILKQTTFNNNGLLISDFCSLEKNIKVLTITSLCK